MIDDQLISISRKGGGALTDTTDIFCAVVSIEAKVPVEAVPEVIAVEHIGQLPTRVQLVI